MNIEVCVFHQHPQVGRMGHYVATFLRMASGPIHEKVLLKFSNAIVASLPLKNDLSHSSEGTALEKQIFARNFVVQSTGRVFKSAPGPFLHFKRCQLLVRLQVKSSCTNSRPRPYRHYDTICPMMFRYNFWQS